MRELLRGRPVGFASPRVRGILSGACAVLPIYALGVIAGSVEVTLSVIMIANGVVAYRVALIASSWLMSGALDPRALRAHGGLGILLLSSSLIGLALWGERTLPFIGLSAFAGAGAALTLNVSLLDLAGDGARAQDPVGFAFQQAAPPLAAFGCGLLIPMVSSAFGWRGAFLASAGTVLVVGFASLPPGAEPTRSSVEASPRTDLQQGVGVAKLGIVFGLTFGAVSAFSVMFVGHAVDIGIGFGTAGSLMALGSVCSMAVRIASGYAVRGGRSAPRLMLGMISLGCVGFVLLAFETPLSMLSGATLVMTFAWSISGLVFIVGSSIASGAAIASAMARLLSAGSLGGICGPLLFGIVGDRFGGSAAWLLCGVALLLGVGLVESLIRDVRVTELEVGLGASSSNGGSDGELGFGLPG